MAKEIWRRTSSKSLQCLSLSEARGGCSFASQTEKKHNKSLKPAAAKMQTGATNRLDMRMRSMVKAMFTE